MNIYISIYVCIYEYSVEKKYTWECVCDWYALTFCETSRWLCTIFWIKHWMEIDFYSIYSYEQMYFRLLGRLIFFFGLRRFIFFSTILITKHLPVTCCRHRQDTDKSRTRHRQDTDNTDVVVFGFINLFFFTL